MNWYIVLAAFLLGVIGGMVLHYYMIRNRIQVKQIHVDKAKVKGRGNTQDLDMEFNEYEELKSARQIRRENRNEKKLDQENKKLNEKLKEHADKQVQEINKLLKE